MTGCDEIDTYQQTNDNSGTDFDSLTTSILLGQFWIEESPPNLMTIVALYNRTGLSCTVRSQIAADDAN